MEAIDGRVGRDGGTDRSGHDQMSTWIELFYDLVYVAAILIFSTAVAHVYPATGITWIVFVFAASWWVWFSTTVSANRFRTSDVPHRALLLFQMFVIVLMAMEARVSVSGDSTYLVLEYGVLLVTVALVYLRAARRTGPDAGFARRLGAVHAAAAACFFVSATLPETARLATAGVAFALCVVLSIVAMHGLPAFSRSDEAHLVERIGAFTLIVCGESFIEVAISVSGARIHDLDITSLVFEFILVFAIFTSYFEDIPAAGLNQRRFGWWAVLHLVAQVSIAGTAVSASKLIHLGARHHIPDVEILRLTLPLATVYLALAGIGACTRRRPAGPLVALRVATGLAIAVVGVAAWWIPWVHMAQALPAFAAIAALNAVLVVRLRAQTGLIDRGALSPV